MKTYCLKFLLVLMGALLSTKGFGGIKWVDIGVNGLTCSMCTRSVEMSVERLDFVDSVIMSLEKTEGRVYLKSSKLVDLKQIARAVSDAGFSVRFLRASFDFSDVAVGADGTFTYQGQPYIWMGFKEGLAKGDVALKLVDEDFLPRKEGAQWKKKIALLANGADRQKIFHVVRDL